MYHLLRALRPVGARRGRRRPGWPTLIPRGTRRVRRGNWVVGEPGPEAEALTVALVLGADPCEEIPIKRYEIGSFTAARRVLDAGSVPPADQLAERRRQRKGGVS